MGKRSGRTMRDDVTSLARGIWLLAAYAAGAIKKSSLPSPAINGTKGMSPAAIDFWAEYDKVLKDKPTEIQPRILNYVAGYSRTFGDNSCIMHLFRPGAIGPRLRDGYSKYLNAGDLVKCVSNGGSKGQTLHIDITALTRVIKAGVRKELCGDSLGFEKLVRSYVRVVMDVRKLEQLTLERVRMRANEIRAALAVTDGYPFACTVLGSEFANVVTLTALVNEVVKHIGMSDDERARIIAMSPPDAKAAFKQYMSGTMPVQQSLFSTKLSEEQEADLAKYRKALAKLDSVIETMGDPASYTAQRNDLVAKINGLEALKEVPVVTLPITQLDEMRELTQSMTQALNFAAMGAV